MSRRSRVLWSEGLFLEPQHFQQHDRFVEGQISGRLAATGNTHWGFHAVELDTALLTLGKLGLTAAQGVFPDGTPFSMPGDDPLPEPLEVEDTVRDKIVYLALPLAREGVVEVARAESAKGLYRYRAEDLDVRDGVLDSSASTVVEVGRLNCRLAVQGESLEQYACVPLARIVEVSADRSLVLDETFIPAVSRCRGAPRLQAYLAELRGLLQQRAELLAARVTASSQGGAGEIADFLMLQIVNRHAPVARHLMESQHVHPETFYRFAIGLAGELATLTLDNRLPPEFKLYRHDHLQPAFDSVFETLRAEFRTVREAPAVPIPLEATGRHGVHVARIHDPSLLNTASFIVAVSASVSGEQLRAHFPMHVKVASVERIAELVNNNLPGIDLAALPVAPRQIPFISSNVYFELDRSNPLWKQLTGSGGLAIHVAGQYPDLKMSLWAIRGASR